jgi:paraquat-inducible protein A
MTPHSRRDWEPVACPGCDLLQLLPAPQPGGRARCPRCGEVLASACADPIDRPLALALAATICLIVANATPLMGISVLGHSAQTTILGGALVMWDQGQALTGALVAICAALAPGGYLLFMLAVLTSARRPPAPRWAGTLLRLAGHVGVWSMPEVMVLGLLVALVKIAELASVDAGVGLYAAVALPVLLAATAVAFDPRAIWERVVWADGESPPAWPEEPTA